MSKSSQKNLKKSNIEIYSQSGFKSIKVVKILLKSIQILTDLTELFLKKKNFKQFYIQTNLRNIKNTIS